VKQQWKFLIEEKKRSCCVLTRLVAKHHTAVRSPSPLSLWDGGEKRESEAGELR